MRNKRNMLNTVRQLAAKRRLERAQVELARAADITTKIKFGNDRSFVSARLLRLQ
jgi:hypothetical protein